MVYSIVDSTILYTIYHIPSTLHIYTYIIVYTHFDNSEIASPMKRGHPLVSAGEYQNM